MVTTPQLKETLYDELVAVFTHAVVGNTEYDHLWSTRAYEEPSFGEDTFKYKLDEEIPSHVRPTNRYENGTFPAYTFDTFDTDINRGMGSGMQVHNVIYNVDDTIKKLIIRREKEMRVDVGAHTANDDVKASDKLYSALEQHFTPFVEDVGVNNKTLHSDVETLRLRGTNDVSSPDDGIRGSRFRMDIEYHTFIEITDVPTMETIQSDFDIILDGTDADFDDVTQN